jgi:hypothetical protein
MRLASTEGKGREGKERKGKGKESSATAAAKEIQQLLETLPGWKEAWELLINDRIEKRFTHTESWARQRMKLMAQRPEEAVAGVQMCVDKGWQGFDWEWYDREKKNKGAGLLGEAADGRFKPNVGEMV